MKTLNPIGWYGWFCDDGSEDYESLMRSILEKAVKESEVKK